MTDLGRFWRALDDLPGLSAVEAEWADRVGNVLPTVRPFLRPGAALATSFPRPDGLPLEVVDHGGGEYVGVCPETGDTVPLTRPQLVVYHVDRRRLGEAVAAAFGADPGGEWPAGEPRSYDLGPVDLGPAGRYRCVLAFPWQEPDVQAIAAGRLAAGDGPLLLLAPTRRWYRRSLDTLLRFRGSAFVPLDEALACPRPGSLRPVRPPAALVAPFADRPVRGEAVPVETVRSNGFLHTGGRWAVTFDGKTVSFEDALGFRYLARLLAAKHRPVEAVALKAAGAGRAIAPSAGVEALDARARAAVRAEYESLQAEIAEAAANADGARHERLQEQRAALADQLASARGVGNRPRRVRDERDAIRTAVRNAIARAIRKIEPEIPALAAHLDAALHFGAAVRYAPEPDVDWVV